MKYLIISLTFFCLVFTSCSKKNEEVDVRDQLVGTYKGTTSYVMYFSQVAGISQPDKRGTDVSIIVVAKSSSSSDVVNITEKGSTDVTYNGSGVANATNGVGFNIMQQVIPISGGSAIINGTSSYSLGSSKFDGAYFSDTKALKYKYSGNANIKVNGISYSVPYEATQDLVKQ